MEVIIQKSIQKGEWIHRGQTLHSHVEDSKVTYHSITYSQCQSTLNYMPLSTSHYKTKNPFFHFCFLFSVEELSLLSKTSLYLHLRCCFFHFILDFLFCQCGFLLWIICLTIFHVLSTPFILYLFLGISLSLFIVELLKVFYSS